MPRVLGDPLCLLALDLQPQHRCECAFVRHLGVLPHNETEALARPTGNIDAHRSYAFHTQPACCWYGRGALEEDRTSGVSACRFSGSARGQLMGCACTGITATYTASTAFDVTGVTIDWVLSEHLSTLRARIAHCHRGSATRSKPRALLSRCVALTVLPGLWPDEPRLCHPGVLSAKHCALSEGPEMGSDQHSTNGVSVGWMGWCFQTVMARKLGGLFPTTLAGAPYGI